MNGPKRKLLTLGYGAGWSCGMLREALAETGAILADIRLHPWSRTPAWRKSSLSESFGERYVHVPALGNLNYRGGGPILLADPEQGAAQIGSILAREAAVLLLCGCRDVTACHRKTVAEFCAARLGKRWNFDIHHLEPPHPRHPDLFAGLDLRF